MNEKCDSIDQDDSSNKITLRFLYSVDMECFMLEIAF